MIDLSSLTDEELECLHCDIQNEQRKRIDELFDCRTPSVYNQRHNPPDNAVYVGRGRGSKWGNPFREGKDGTREEVIAKFEKYACERIKREPAWLDPLIGKDLVCWCAPKPCHADVLLRLANRKEV